MKTTKQLFLLCLFGMIGLGARAELTYVTVGNQVNGYSNLTALCGWYENSSVQAVYSSNDMKQSGTIESVAFSVASASAIQTSSVRIYMGHKSSNYFSDSNDFLKPNDLTLVYSGSPIIGAATGWEDYILQSPFQYDGSNALVIVICKQAPYSKENLKYHGSGGCLYRGSHDSGDASLPSYSSMTYYEEKNYYKPTVRFGFSNHESTTFIDNGIEYITTSNRTCTLKDGSEATGDLILPSRVFNNGIGYEVVNIGESAFAQNQNITSVSLPVSLLNVEKSAFSLCSKLESITLPNGLVTIGDRAFYGYTNLESLTIPSTVTSIGDYAFSLRAKEIVIQDSSCGISCGESVFYNNTLAASLYLGRNLYYDENSFCSAFFNNPFKEVTISEKVDQIGKELLANSQISTITIPSSVKSIGDKALPMSLQTIIIEDSDTPLTLGCYPNKVNEGSSYLPVYKDYHYGLFYRCHLDSLYLGRDLTFTTRELKEEYPGCGAPFENNTLLRSVVVSEKVTKLDDDLFAGCTGLENIVLKDAEITLSIGVHNLSSSSKGSMFKDAHLKFVNLGRNISYQSSNYNQVPFANQDSLRTVTIGNYVTELNDYLFYNCDTLKAITLPDGLAKIGERAFYDCNQIEEVIIPATVEFIGTYAFANCAKLASVVMEDGEKELEISLPFYYSSVEKIYIGRNLIYTNNSNPLISTTYGQAKTLKSATLGNGVTTVGDYLFYSCDSLNKVTLPESIKSIGKYAFAYCGSLETVQLPSGVTTIDDYAFFRSVRRLSIPQSVLTIGEEVFNGSNYANYELKELTIEDGSTPLTLGRSLFSNCALETVYIGRDLEYTKKEETNYSNEKYYGAPFEYNITLKSAVLGDSVTTIKAYLFYNCANLKKVTTGESIKKIESECFSSTGLDTISFKVATPPNGTSLGIWGKKLITYVPRGTAANWRSNTYWKSQIIIDEDEDVLFVELTEPGSLASKIIEKGTLPANVAKLKIKGEMNDTDWGILKPSSMGQLYYLDLSEVTNDSIPAKQFQNTSYNSTYVSIKDVIFQKTLKRIGDYAFDYCHRLSGDLVLPQTIERIGACAMRGTSYTSITLPDKEVTAVIDSSAFDRSNGAYFPISACTETIKIGDNWKIGSMAFLNNTALKNVSIGKNSKIGYKAFYNCYAMTNLHFSENTNIGELAFYNNNSLTALSIPGYGTTIGNSAFESCSKLEDVHFSEGLATIGNKAFFNCNNISGEIQIPHSVSSLGDYVFYYAKLIESISLGDNLESIGNYAFYNCTGLKSVKMGQNIASIGDNAFYGCEQIERLELPLNLKTLGNYAFYGCKKLKELEIHSKVESFGQNNGSFYGCDSIVKVTSHQKTPIGIIYNSFTNNVYNKAELYIPKNSSGNYLLADGWKNFINFKEYEDDEIAETTTILIANSDGTDGSLYVKTGEDITIQDGIQRLIVSRNVFLHSITYTRAFNNTSWQSLYVPFEIPVTAELLNEFDFAYINAARQYDYDDDGEIDNLTIEVFKVKNGTLRANHPYLIRAKSTGSKTITVNDATLFATASNSVTCSTTSLSFTFKGAYETLTYDDLAGCRLLGGGEWKTPSATATMKPMRFYMKIESRGSDQIIPAASSATPIRMTVVGEDGDATEIIPTPNPSREGGEFFDLQGRQVEHPVNGIYIINGKKVIVK